MKYAIAPHPTARIAERTTPRKSSPTMTWNTTVKASGSESKLALGVNLKANLVYMKNKERLAIPVYKIDRSIKSEFESACKVFHA